MMTDPKKVLVDEFSSYYMSEELSSLIQGDLDEWIGFSARRIAHDEGTSAREVAELLRELAADRAHPFMRDLDEASVYDWTDEDHDWVIFQHIARGIAAGIEQALSTTSDGPA